ncbi:MAG: TonB-dependent receptor, partial [Lentisphaerae bacterium]|nr:TonB-dependent receptor [Lentisphaerota bacterium]
AFVNRNSGAFAVRGVEAGLDLRPRDNLNATLHYTYTDIDDGPPGNPDLNRQGKPEHVVNMVAAYRLGALVLTLEGEYVQGLYDSNLLAGGDIRKVDDFLVVDMKAAYAVNDDTDLFVGVENMLDDDYEQIPGYPMPGATVFAGVKAAL